MSLVIVPGTAPIWAADTLAGGNVVPNSGYVATGVTFLNASVLNQGNIDENVNTLLHELGHIYNELLGSGGSSIQYDGFLNPGGQTTNDNLIIQNCTPIYPWFTDEANQSFGNRHIDHHAEHWTWVQYRPSLGRQWKDSGSSNTDPLLLSGIRAVPS